jgi:tetratricopeptide (TPR) repeat protein
MVQYGTRETYEATVAALKDREPLVRLAAARNLEAFHGVSTSTRWDFDALPADEAKQLAFQSFMPLAELAGPLLKDSVRAVRFEAARALAVVPPGLLDSDVRQTLASVVAEFRAGCLDSGDQAASHAMLAELAGAEGDLAEAEREYRLAMARLPDFIPARTGLANLYRHQRKHAEAEKLLRESLKIAEKLAGDERRHRPQEAELRYHLGLLVASAPGTSAPGAIDPNDVAAGQHRPRLKEAGQLVAQALRLAPDHTRARFAWATVLRDLNEWEAAEAQYLRAYEEFPLSQEYQGGLISIYQQQIARLSQRQQWREALPYAKKLVQLVPGERRFAAQLREIEGKAK